MNDTETNEGDQQGHFIHQAGGSNSFIDGKESLIGTLEVQIVCDGSILNAGRRNVRLIDLL